MTMKKKLLLIVSVALLLTAAGYGTYAALNASATASNVIRMGTVTISLRDQLKVEGPSGEEELWTEFPETFQVSPGAKVTKRIFVKNEGANPCYVRVMVRPDQTEDEQTVLGSGGVAFDCSAEKNPMWERDSDGYYRYTKILDPQEETSEALICDILFSPKMTNEYAGTEFRIKNFAQGVQSKNNAFDAQNGSVLDVQGWPAEETGTASDSHRNGKEE